jgi:hypothetical protein
MINKNKMLLSRSLGRTRRHSKWNIGRRETSHHFSKKILKDNHFLDSPEWLR